MPAPVPDDAVGSEPSTRATAARGIGWLLLVYFVFLLSIHLLAREQLLSNRLFVLIIELALFSITAAMLVAARTSLRIFRIDRLSLVLFIVFGTVLRLPRPGDIGVGISATYWAFVPVALVPIFAIWRSRIVRNRWAGTKWPWMLIGLLSGSLLGVLLAAIFPLVLGKDPIKASVFPVTIGSLILTFLYSMGHTAILEEPVGRGFLWGWLELHGQAPVSIFVVQAVVFWLAHLRYIDHPFTFWVALPLGGLMLGWLSWKSGSVAPGMVAHAAYNTLSAFF